MDLTKWSGLALAMGLLAVSADALAQPANRTAQAAMCAVIEKGAAAYGPIRTAWGQEENPIQKDRIAARMATMRDARDAEVLAVLGTPRPVATGWSVTVRGFDTSSRWLDGTIGKVAILDLDPGCAVRVTLTVEAPLTDALTERLAQVKRGTALDVSGAFLPHDMPPNPLARAINWDGFEGSAMRTPSYRLRATMLGGVTIP